MSVGHFLIALQTEEGIKKDNPRGCISQPPQLRGFQSLPADPLKDHSRKISRPFKTPGGAAKAWCAYLDYYGVGGFSAEVMTILEKMRSEPEKGAAMFRNRITTPQHYELWRDILNHAVDGKKGPVLSPPEPVVGQV